LVLKQWVIDRLIDEFGNKRIKLLNSFDDTFFNNIKATFLEKYTATKLEPLNAYIRNELEIIRDVIKFVPNAYIINTGKMSSDLIPMLIEKDNAGNEKTIIVTNNKLAAVNFSFSDNVAILDVKGIDSCFYNASNVNQFFGVKSDNLESFRDNLCHYVAVTGFSKYDIPKVTKTTSAKLLTILNDSTAYEELYAKFKDEINSNLAFLDFEKRIANMNTLELNANFYGFLQDLVMDDVKVLNNEIFNKYPVNIDFLFKI
jgi:hypothetical protein